MKISHVLTDAERLFARGEYFECHERLEGHWMKAEEPWKTCLQGLIQIAAAFHKLKTEPEKYAGAAYLLEKGLEKVARAGTLDQAVVDRISKELNAVLPLVRSGGFSPAKAPRLRWAK